MKSTIRLFRVAAVCAVLATSGVFAASVGASARPSASASATKAWVVDNCKKLVTADFKADFGVTPSPVKVYKKSNCEAYYGYDAANSSAEMEVVIAPSTAAEAKSAYDGNYSSLQFAQQKNSTIVLKDVPNVGDAAIELSETADDISVTGVDSYGGTIWMYIEANNYPAVSFSEMATFERQMYRQIAKAT